VKIRDALKGSAQVYLTRSFDRTFTLADRANLAEKIKADLFISIHFNSSADKESHGHEIYYLDNSKDQAVSKVERTENSMPKGVDPIVNQILIDLVISQTVKTSTVLASNIRSELIPVLSKNKLTDRGIKPGLFYVLALSKRPGILLEVGFVSNSPELKKINQEEFMNNYARAVSRGIMSFWKNRKK
jgi:N-acetylmuramoyl-L-alanine amidase